MPANPYGVPITNNGAGQNMAQWVGTYERWMNDMMGMGWNIDDIVKMTQDAGETFPKSLIATAHSKNALFPSANMLYEYDLDNHMRRSMPHNNADYPNGTGYGEWEPMTAGEQADARNYYAWRENPANYSTIDNQYKGNAYNAYLAMNKNPNDPNPTAKKFTAGGNTVNNGGVRSTASTGAGTGAGAGTSAFGGNVDMGPIMDELTRNMRLDTATQQFNLDRGIREYSEGRPIQNYLTDLYGQVMGVGFDRPQFSLSAYDDFLNPGGRGSGASKQLVRPDNWDQMTPQEKVDWRQDQTTTPTTEPLNDNLGGRRGDGTGHPRQDPSGGGPIVTRPNPPVTDPSLNPGRYEPSGGVEKTSAGGVSSMSGGGQVIIPYDPGGNYNMPWANNPLNPYSPNYQGTISGNNVATGDVSSSADVSTNPVGKPIETTLPVRSMTGGSSASPDLPTIPVPEANYHQLSNSFNPNNPTTWSLLAAPAAQLAGDLDSQRGQIERSMPAGGERNLALSQAINQKYAQVGGLKQGLMGQSLTGLGNISQSKLWGQPIPQSGAAGQLLNAGTQQQGNNQQYDLGLKQIDATKQGQKSSMWGSILGAIGGVAAGALLSDIRTKEDVKPFTRGLDDLKKIRPFTYSYNGEGGSKRGERGISIMAQDLNEAIPEAVVDGGFKEIVPMGLLLTAVNSINELSKKVKKLEKEKK